MNSQTDFYYINDILVRKENEIGVLYVAAGISYYENEWHQGVGGLFRSIDYGITFSQVLPGTGDNNMSYQPSDIELDENNNIWIGTRNNAWGEGGGTILKSNSGTLGSWIVMYNDDYADSESSGKNRVELAVGSDNAVYAIGEGGSGTDDISFFIKSENGGAGWISITIPLYDVPWNDENPHFTRGQADYDLILAVHPENADVVIAGGIDLHRSTDGGENWTQISGWWLTPGDDNYAHADQHNIIFRPENSNTVLFANDGGIHAPH